MIKFITLLLLICAFNLNATKVVSGTFEATQNCPAYLSKNKKSNPDNLMVHPNQSYQIKAINKSPAEWLYIELPEHHNTLRWVNVTCGISDFVEKNSGICDYTAGMADSHVLALSSQSGFCETYGYEAGKPECRKLARNSYQANHLTLHGLWPNQDNCGQHYGFCGASPKSNHCDYSPVDLSNKVAIELKRLMPSYNYGSCLERHEWNKHGTCTILSTDDYFSLAMRLVTEMDTTEFGQYLTEHKGQTVNLATLRGLLNQTFGFNNAGKIRLSCTQGRLVDVLILLPASLPANESLLSLVNKAPDHQYHDGCPKSVIISNFTKESWY